MRMRSEKLISLKLSIKVGFLDILLIPSYLEFCSLIVFSRFLSRGVAYFWWLSVSMHMAVISRDVVKLRNKLFCYSSKSHECIPNLFQVSSYASFFNELFFN